MWKLWKQQNNAGCSSSLPFSSACFIFLCQAYCKVMNHLWFCFVFFFLFSWFACLPFRKCHCSGLFVPLGFCRIYSRKCEGQSGWLQAAGVRHPTRPIHLPCYQQTQQNLRCCQSCRNHQCFRYAGKKGVVNNSLFPAGPAFLLGNVMEEEGRPWRAHSLQGAKFEYQCLPCRAISPYILTPGRLAQLSLPACLVLSCTLCPRSTWKDHPCGGSCGCSPTLVSPNSKVKIAFLRSWASWAFLPPRLLMGERKDEPGEQLQPPALWMHDAVWWLCRAQRLRQISYHVTLSYHRCDNDRSVTSFPFLLSSDSSPSLGLVPPWQSGGKDGFCGCLGILWVREGNSDEPKGFGEFCLNERGRFLDAKHMGEALWRAHWDPL